LGEGWAEEGCLSRGADGDGGFVWRRANKTTPLNCKEAADKFRSAVADVEKVSAIVPGCHVRRRGRSCP